MYYITAGKTRAIEYYLNKKYMCVPFPTETVFSRIIIKLGIWKYGARGMSP
jgi:hypothetical protein